MPSLRPRWSTERWAAARAPAGPVPTIVASWVDGGLHLWGWDGAHTALPTGLRRAFDTPTWRVDPFQVGHLSSVEVRLPDGDTIRPATVRMPSAHVTRWLGALSERERGESDSLAWLSAVADLAAATVAAGLVTPRVGEERDMLVARWVPVPDDTVDAALVALDAARPPIWPTRRRRWPTSTPRWSTPSPATDWPATTGDRRCPAVAIRRSRPPARCCGRWPIRTRPSVAAASPTPTSWPA